MTTPSIALSIRPVFAYLIALGVKDIENRTWKTNFRGPFWIHASKNIDLTDYSWVQAHAPEAYRLLPDPSKLPAGGIIGQVNLVEVVESHNSPWYMPGHYGFVLAEAQILPFTPFKGKLGFFVPDPTAIFTGQKLPNN